MSFADKIQRIALSGLFVFGFIFSGQTWAEDITIDQDATWGAGTHTYDNVWITNGAALTFDGAVTLNATNLTVEVGSSISADGKGYPACTFLCQRLLRTLRVV